MAGGYLFHFAMEVAPPEIVPLEKLKVPKVLETIKEEDAESIEDDAVEPEMTRAGFDRGRIDLNCFCSSCLVQN